MAIISHTHRFIFLATAKTASSSVEASLVRHIGPRDWIRVTTDIGPVDHPFFRCAGRTTHWFPRETTFKSGLGRTGLFPPLRLKKHASAHHVRGIVGPRRWDEYLTFAIERNPWDRFISLWRWKTRRDHRSAEEFFEEYEREMLATPAHPIVSEWRTWPVYAIDDTIAVDTVVRFEHLTEDLTAVLSRAGIDWDGWLPRLKSRHRQLDDRPGTLSPVLIDRIGELCAREIEAHGYRPPVGLDRH